MNSPKFSGGIKNLKSVSANASKIFIRLFVSLYLGSCVTIEIEMN